MMTRSDLGTLNGKGLMREYLVYGIA
jgi:hypothetical protein